MPRFQNQFRRWKNPRQITSSRMQFCKKHKIHRASAGAPRTLAHAHFNCLLSRSSFPCRGVSVLFFLSSLSCNKKRQSSLLKNVTAHTLTLVLRCISKVEPLIYVSPKNSPYFVLREFFFLTLYQRNVRKQCELLTTVVHSQSEARSNG